jgi:nitrogen fixation/metabolism regulation signal transduction histidine kinase
MSLKNKIILFMGTLLVLMAASQWYLVHIATKNIAKELGQVAFSVASDTARFFISDQYQFNQEILLQALQSSNLAALDQTTIRYLPPEIELRINNKITDNEIQLITLNGSQTIPIPRSGIVQAVANIEHKLMLGTLLIFISALVLAGWFAHRISAPLRMIAKASHELSSGQLGTTIKQDKTTAKELTATIQSFNEMSVKLAELDQLKSKLVEAQHYKELGELARGLAHSIRNPLNTLGLTIEQLAETNQQQSKQQLAQAASNQIERIDQWVQTFMILSISEEFETHAIDVTEVIQDIQLEATYRVDKPVNFDLTALQALSIEGVETEVKAMLHAIIVNAVQASNANDKVIIRGHSLEQDRLLIEVEDFGSGLDQAIEQSLFKPHSSTKAKGSGLGLYMAQRLAVARYQGQISLTNKEPNKGVIAQIKLATKRS